MVLRVASAWSQASAAVQRLHCTQSRCYEALAYPRRYLCSASSKERFTFTQALLLNSKTFEQMYYRAPTTQGLHAMQALSQLSYGPGVLNSHAAGLCRKSLLRSACLPQMVRRITELIVTDHGGVMRRPRKPRLRGPRSRHVCPSVRLPASLYYSTECAESSVRISESMTVMIGRRDNVLAMSVSDFVAIGLPDSAALIVA